MNEMKYKTVVIRIMPELYEKIRQKKENMTWIQVMEDWLKKNESEVKHE